MDVIRSTLGKNAISINDINHANDNNIYAPGYAKIASCKSSITFIDGAKGELLHRGYEIEDFINNRDYIDLCYLLLHRSLPTQSEYNALLAKLKELAMTFPLKKITLHKNPMKSVSSALLDLGDYLENDKFAEDKNFIDTAYAILAYMPTIIFHIIRNKSEIENKGFLDLYTGQHAEQLGMDKQMIDSIWHKLLIIHADHEQNASTATVRLACSTGADIIMSMVAGVSSLSGPKHGAANVFAINMLNNIGSVDNVAEYIQKVKNKEALLYGFGHRVYKNFDPRSKVLKSIYKGISSTGDRLFDIAEELSKHALDDDYFKTRNLYPNVDFYSGLTLRALGIEDKYFTTIFAFGRMIGWLSHMHENINDKEQKIGRPFQIYTGEERRSCPKR